MDDNIVLNLSTPDYEQEFQNFENLNKGKRKPSKLEDDSSNRSSRSKIQRKSRSTISTPTRTIAPKISKSTGRKIASKISWADEVASSSKSTKSTDKSPKLSKSMEKNSRISTSTTKFVPKFSKSTAEIRKNLSTPGKFTKSSAPPSAKKFRKSTDETSSKSITDFPTTNFEPPVTSANRTKLKNPRSISMDSTSTTRKRKFQKVSTNEDDQSMQEKSRKFRRSPDKTLVEIADFVDDRPKIAKSRSKSTDSKSPSKVLSKSKPVKSNDVFSADTFSAIDGVDRKLIERLERDDGFGFKRQTAVQKLTIPELLKGKDCFVKSQTGSGKTLAYAIPCVQKLSELEPRIKRLDGPYAIVLTPTRELTIQTYEVFEKLLKAFIWIVPGYIAGGEKRKSEKARLRKGINILVCTPGRLTDHLRTTSCLSLENVRWMVYDEADRLLDGGFEQDVKSVIDRLLRTRGGKCQSVLLSATLNKGVKQLADLALTNPTFVSPSDSAPIDGANGGDHQEGFGAADDQDEFVLPTSLNQSYVITPAKQRLLTLLALIYHRFRASSTEKMLVFAATADSVDFHYNILDHVINGSGDDDDVDEDDDGDGLPISKRRRRATDDNRSEKLHVEIYRLHGNMSQQERTAVYKEFSTAKTALLLATDVAARGLHIPKLDCIVQYNTPGVVAEYVHRVGRTARMGRTGEAIMFLLPSEIAYLDVLSEKNIRIKEMRQNDFMDVLCVEASIARLPDALFEYQRRFEHFVYSRSDVYEMARKAFISFLRAYTTYPAELRSIFNVQLLHSGHLAKCYALRESPTELGAYRGRGGGSGGSRGNFNRFQRDDRYSRGGGGGGGFRRGSSSGQFRRQDSSMARRFNSRGDDSDRSPYAAVRRRGPIDMSEFGSGFDSIESER